MKRSVAGPLLGLLLAALSLIGCQDAEELEDAGTLRGAALAGPTCPVVRDPPDPACDDRPVAGAELRIEDAGGAEVTRLTTDAGGRFEVSLAPGAYTLVPQPVDGLMGTAPPQSFEIAAGEPTELIVTYDTGIR